VSLEFFGSRGARLGGRHFWYRSALQQGPSPICGVCCGFGQFLRWSLFFSGFEVPGAVDSWSWGWPVACLQGAGEIGFDGCSNSGAARLKLATELRGAEAFRFERLVPVGPPPREVLLLESSSLCSGRCRLMLLSFAGVGQGEEFFVETLVSSMVVFPCAMSSATEIRLPRCDRSGE